MTFRIYAPEARSVALRGEMFEFRQPPVPLARAADGVWSVTVGPIAPGAYRYLFRVDGVGVVDPKNLETSASASVVQSLLVNARDDVSAQKDVPHGAVSEVYYKSPELGLQRRMHVYTPPGYGREGRTYPVLYLIHGGGDSDESWPTVGRAGFIMDNLIAEGKSLPMVVVMPAGGVGGKGQPMTWDARKDPFTTDLLTAIIPYVQANYRVSTRPEERALAGLSMGGIQTLNIGLTHSDRFRWLGIFSSGWFGGDLAAFDQTYGSSIRERTSKLSLLYYTNGAEDISLPQAKTIYAFFDRKGVKYESHETPGGHTWENWRANLADFAPKLFRR